MTGYCCKFNMSIHIDIIKCVYFVPKQITICFTEVRNFWRRTFYGQGGFHIGRNSLVNVSYTQKVLTETSAGLVTICSNLRDRLVPLVYCRIYFLTATGGGLAFSISVSYLLSTAIPTFRRRIKLLASPEFCKSINTLTDEFQGSTVPIYSANSPHVVLQHRIHKEPTNSGQKISYGFASYLWVRSI